MAIKVSDTTVIDDSRNASNLVSVSASSVTALSFYGDGSNLSGIAVSTTFLVSGRSANTSVLLSANSFVVEGRGGNVTIPI